MYRNYILVALRNLRRQVLYSFINILGLGIGMASSLVIFLYVFGEWSHDRHFENADRIYRVGFSFFNIGRFAKGPELLGEYLPQYDVVSEFTRFTKYGQLELETDKKVFNELVYAADDSFFKVFSYTFRAGDPLTALVRPRSIVVSEEVALKLFQSTDVLGKIIAVGEERIPHEVTGVVTQSGRPSHLKAGIWMTLDFDDSKDYHWTSASYYNYVLVREGATPGDLEKALASVIEKNILPTTGKQMGINTIDEYYANENSPRFHVQSLKDIYLRSKLNLELSPGGNETNVLVFGIVGMVILVLASVNFVNLSTARSVRRAREVGIRKALGTTRGKLMGQFLLESVFVSLISMAVALGIAELFTFLFYWITGQPLAIELWSHPYGPLGVLLFAVVVGMISGLYPAFYLTRFQPVAVLRGQTAGPRSGAFRSTLVVFQFSISIALITTTMVILQQLNFMSTHELGFDEENVIVVENIPEVGASVKAWKEELMARPGVVTASFHTGEPGSKATITMNTFQTEGMTTPFTINTYYGDEQFLKLMGFSILAGRGFNADLASDSAAVILNESAVTALGIADNPIGTRLNDQQVVIGVVRNFHWESLRNEIAPTAILPGKSVVNGPGYVQLGLKVERGHIRQTLDAIERDWARLVPGQPLEYHFLDENFEILLARETVLAKAVGFFTILAIVISCLGLFGLSAYTTQQRTREIGIRKVMGASVEQIVIMLTSQFTRLVLVASAVAVPVAFWAATGWLSGFAYRMELGVGVFVTGAAIGFIISASTVLFHSVRASENNPATTLKCE